MSSHKIRYSHVPLPMIRLNAKEAILSKKVPMVASERMLHLAVCAPLAPILMLSDIEKSTMEHPLLIPTMSYYDILALSMATEVAEFVLE